MSVRQFTSVHIIGFDLLLEDSPMRDTSLNPFSLLAQSYDFGGAFSVLQFIIYLITVTVPVVLLTWFLLSGTQEWWSYLSIAPILIIFIISHVGALLRLAHNFSQ